MSKIAVIYWTGTGNTEAMASAVAEGVGAAGVEAVLLNVSAVTAKDAAEYDRLALGCPAMGDEVLEESEFEPFFTELERSLKGKKAALFGSYGWGDGQWMRDWEERAKAAGCEVVGNGLIVNETPDEEGLAQCRDLGSQLAKA